MNSVNIIGERPFVSDDLTHEYDTSPRRPRIDPDDRDEYEEWRREQGSRGRKRKDKAGGRHWIFRDDDVYLGW